MAAKHQRNRRLLVKTNSSERSGQNGEVSSRETIDRGYRKSLWQADDSSEATCHRGEIRTMEGILGLLSKNSSGTVNKMIARSRYSRTTGNSYASKEHRVNRLTLRVHRSIP